MATISTIKGHVIYKEFNPSEIEMNIVLADNHTKGFVIGCARDIKTAYPDILKNADDCEDVSLELVDGQVKSVCFEVNGCGQQFEIMKLKDLGVRFKDKAEKKISARFLSLIRRKDDLLLTVELAAQSSYCLKGKNLERVERLLRQAAAGDRLELYQEADGRISSITNVTKAFEVSC